jgi:hypothetical protein
VKHSILAACLSIAALFAWSAPEANADHWHHGHGHHHGHYHHGGYGHWHPGAYPVGGYWTGYYGPRVSRVYSYPSYYAPPVQYYAPPVQVYHYDYYRPQNSLFIGGRNFSFGLEGF